MDTGDLETAMRLSRAAGWNQTVADWQLFLQSSPHGCFVTVHDEQVVGTVTTISYDKVAWISMMLVDPAFQRMGIGRALMERALEYLYDIPCIKLDATPAGQPLYEKLGFVEEDELFRWTCESLTFVEPPAADKNQSLEPIETNAIQAVVEFDRQTFGAARAGVLGALRDAMPACAWQMKNKNSIEAISLGRPGSMFEQLGPVDATEFKSAQLVTRTALHALRGRAVVMDVPAMQTEYSAWLQERGFVCRRPLRRMVKGAPPQPFSAQQFAIAGPELG